MVERGGLEAYEREMWAAERRSKREANVLNANRGALKKRFFLFFFFFKTDKGGIDLEAEDSECLGLYSR